MLSADEHIDLLRGEISALRRVSHYLLHQLIAGGILGDNTPGDLRDLAEGLRDPDGRFALNRYLDQFVTDYLPPPPPERRGLRLVPPDDQTPKD